MVILYGVLVWRFNMVFENGVDERSSVSVFEVTDQATAILGASDSRLSCSSGDELILKAQVSVCCKHSSDNRLEFLR